ncbi:hypothetical protein M011DRAFT_88850 [Sporormia fimetaria CBS 119925]|uniref:Uncharacterized protein n=1 Tax=Sporormia fimetaria CBS 119925 TaxID=1340428 RepID=A0A6A6V946_9PLEO|nr:hypothetical protein M011DRAFT_88850 [Sporormia fimetaria CBS 119925]
MMSQSKTASYDEDAHNVHFSDLVHDQGSPFYGQEQPGDISLFQGYPATGYGSSEAIANQTNGFEHCQLDTSLTATGTPYSTNTSAVQTPDFPNTPLLRGSQTPSTYPSTPAPDTPLAYHVQFQGQHLQPAFDSYEPQLDFSAVNARLLHPGTPNQRPGLLRSATHNSLHISPFHLHHGSFSRVHQPSHRRSLSQGDADRIAAARTHLLFQQQQQHHLHTQHQNLQQHPQPQPQPTYRQPLRRTASSTSTQKYKRTSSRNKPYLRASPAGRLLSSPHGKAGKRKRTPTSAPVFQDHGDIDIVNGTHDPDMAALLGAIPTFTREWTNIGTPKTAEDEDSRCESQQGWFRHAGRLHVPHVPSDDGTGTPNAVMLQYGMDDDTISPMSTHIPHTHTGGEMNIQLTGAPATSSLLPLAHMPHTAQLSSSARVIEIGAMAVLSAPVPDVQAGATRAENPEGADAMGDNDMLKLVERLETHFMLQGETPEGEGGKGMGLKGCSMIRSALCTNTTEPSGQVDMSVQGDEAGSGEGGAGSPSTTIDAKEQEQQQEQHSNPTATSPFLSPTEEEFAMLFRDEGRSHDLSGLLEDELEAGGYNF